MMTISTLYLCVFVFVCIYTLAGIRNSSNCTAHFLHLEAVVFDRMATDEEKSL